MGAAGAAVVVLAVVGAAALLAALLLAGAAAAGAGVTGACNVHARVQQHTARIHMAQFEGSLNLLPIPLRRPPAP